LTKHQKHSANTLGGRWGWHLTTSSEPQNGKQASEHLRMQCAILGSSILYSFANIRKNTDSTRRSEEPQN